MRKHLNVFLALIGASMNMRDLLLFLLVIAVFFLFPVGVPIVLMALARDRTRHNVKGGGLAQIREISPSQTDAFSDLGYLGGTDLNDEHNVLELMDEAGVLADAMSGSRSVKIVTRLKQSSIDEINLLKNAVNKYYELYYKSPLHNGRFQELVAIPVKFKPGPVLEFKSATERVIELTIYLLAPKNTSTVTRAPVAYNLPAGEPYVIIENASAQGVPTEVTSGFATVISSTL